MSCYSREEIQIAMESKGYKYFTGGDWDVNIIGVRNSKTKGRVTNAFDDCVTISYKEDGKVNQEVIGVTGKSFDNFVAALKSLKITQK